MALKRLYNNALQGFLDNPSETIDQLVESDKVAAAIFTWLADLKLLHGVPFRYLVPDERMLPPESIRFFNVDMNWLDALVDGAYSIGRYATKDANSTSLGNHVEGRFYTKVHEKSAQAARDKRATLLKADASGSPAPFEQVSGLLLRSQVVRGWKSLQVTAFDKNHYPGNPSGNDIAYLTPLRIERLSDEVLLALFEGDLYRVDIHEPSEGVHFGFDPDGNDQLSKNLRNPNDGTDLSGKTLSNQQLMAGNVFRSYAPQTPPAKGGQVVNLYQLSSLLYSQLTADGQGPGYQQPVPTVLEGADANNPVAVVNNATAYPLASSDFAMQMVEGVGMVSFYNDSSICTNPSTNHG